VGLKTSEREKRIKKVPWGGTFATLERRPWGSLEKDLHLL
jgi:hypothetical protein